MGSRSFVRIGTDEFPGKVPKRCLTIFLNPAGGSGNGIEYLVVFNCSRESKNYLEECEGYVRDSRSADNPYWYCS